MSLMSAAPALPPARDARCCTGAVGLFHVAGVTPEAKTLDMALGGMQPARIERLDPGIVLEIRDGMSSATGDVLDLVAVGSPHFSGAEYDELLELLAGRKAGIPIYACTGRHTLERLNADGRSEALRAAGVRLVADTCVVVTPVVESPTGVLMTNSGKFAHYSKSLIGHDVVFGTLAECVESAVAGRVVRDAEAWGVAT